ncbi:MAG TPA: ATP-binding protein [Candidatus Saccharimonadales bacterium]|nr:ATP-binding protein [Candidatus Saccharimonadales bacterium]
MTFGTYTLDVGMQITVSLAVVTVVGALAGILGFFLMRRKYLAELARVEKREEELSHKAYEASVLRAIDERVGTTLDASQIIEIISGSLGQLLPYSTVSNMSLIKADGKLRFEVFVNESVSREFVDSVKVKMLASFSQMLGEPLTDFDIDERISGRLLDAGERIGVRSSFTLPITISEKVVGLINVASYQDGLYKGEEVVTLQRIAKQASDAVSRLHEVLENEKGKLLQAVESLSDGVMMVDTRYQLILANKQLRRFLGLFDQPKIFDVVNALSGKFDLRTKMEEALAREESSPSEEIEIRDKVLQVITSRVIDRKIKKPIGVVVLFHDITDAKSLEKLRQDFMAVMVHELRSPLTSIKSTVELLDGDLPKVSQDELKKYLETIEATSQTMLELVNDLLDVAKMEAGKFDVICEAGDLEGLVLERIEAYKPMAAEKHLSVVVDIAKDIPEAWFDKVRMKQVLNNLLSNAVKYTDNGEVKIKVSCEKVNGTPIDILISIADTGVGIAQDEMDKLFSRFGQLQMGMKKTGNKSSGLGLFIAKGIVEASGGKIWVDSPGIGLGSTFYVTIGLASTEGKIKNQQKGQQQAHAPQLKAFSTTKVARA